VSTASRPGERPRIYFGSSASAAQESSSGFEHQPYFPALQSLLTILTRGRPMTSLMLEVPTSALLHSPRSVTKHQIATTPQQRLARGSWLEAMAEFLFRCLPAEQAMAAAASLASNYSPLGLSFSKVMSLRMNDYRNLLPVLRDAPRLRHASFSTADLVDVEATGSFKMLRLPQHRAKLRKVTHAYLAGSPLVDLQRETLDALVSDLLPHVKQCVSQTHPGAALTVDDCIFFDAFMESGAYYPSLHWDNNCHLPCASKHASPRRWPRSCACAHLSPTPPPRLVSGPGLSDPPAWSLRPSGLVSPAWSLRLSCTF